MATLGVIFGGPSPEHDISVLTGLQVAVALSSSHEPAASGSDLHALYWAKTGRFFEVPATAEALAFVDGPPLGASPLSLVAEPGRGFVVPAGRLTRERSLGIDVAVVCCHGGPGEDGRLQGALDLAGIAYTGPSAAASALGMDKLAFSALASAAGMPVLPRVLAPAAPLPGTGPFIVKPRFGGSSIGIEVAEDAETARQLVAASTHLAAGAVVEPYRRDLYDLNVAVRTWPQVSVSAIERPLRRHPDGEILSYADKYAGGEGMISAPRELPAQVADELATRIRTIASDLVTLAGLRGIVRVDFLASDAGELYLNEVNTIPGSMAKYLWVDPDVPFATLLDDLVAEATQRPPAAFVTTGADGTALRAAGTIGSKLA